MDTDRPWSAEASAAQPSLVIWVVGCVWGGNLGKLVGGQQRGKALVGDLAAAEEEHLELRQSAPRRGEGSQPRVPDLVVAEVNVVERGQRPLGEGGGEYRLMHSSLNAGNAPRRAKASAAQPSPSATSRSPSVMTTGDRGSLWPHFTRLPASLTNLNAASLPVTASRESVSCHRCARTTSRPNRC